MQIDATQRIRATLNAAQYQQLRQRAHAQAPAAPAMPEYSLLLPAHLPHLMPFVAKLDASPEHQQALSRYADEQVRPALRPRLQQAQQLEQEIARAALDGRSAQDLAPQLDRLAQVRREAAEIHLRCIAQVRQTLPPEQYAALRAFAGGPEIDAYLGHCRAVLAALGQHCAATLRDAGCRVPTVGGAFYLFPNISSFGLKDMDFCNRLLETEKVAAVPGSAFGAEGYLRLSYATSDAIIAKGLERLGRFCANLKR